MFKSKSMVIFYGEAWSILQTTWLNGHSFWGGGCSSEIQLLKRMKICSNQPWQLSACWTTGDNFKKVLQVGLESQKWGLQLDYE